MNLPIGPVQACRTLLYPFAICVLVSACAFDVSHATRIPTRFEAVDPTAPQWTLARDYEIPLGTGFPTRLRKGTSWLLVGRVPEGDVYKTRDQIVTVEESNIFEAQIVMRGGNLVGFYLPVERNLVPVNPPVKLATTEGG